MKLRHLAAALAVAPVLLLAACKISPIDYTPRYSTFMDASSVVGQAVFSGDQANMGSPTPGQNTMKAPLGRAASYPYTLAQNGYWIPDTGNNRVLGFNGLNSPAAGDAQYVLGQNSFTAGQPNQGGSTPAPNTLDAPAAVAGDGGSHLAVADSGNNRVLIWNAGQPATDANASTVLGQANFGSNSAACSATGMSDPTGVVIAGGKVIVADTGNNRVLIWNDISALTSGQAANVVLGQTSMTTCNANQSTTAGAAPTAQTLSDPTSVWSNGTRLIVADAGNNRVLIWNDISGISSGAPANVVVGQTAFTGAQANQGGAVGAATLDDPQAVSSANGNLFVADTGNNRVLIFSGMPAANGASASIVLGQGDFSHHAANDDNQDGSPDSGPTARTLDAPAGLTAFGQDMLVADTGNHRWLDFVKRIPTQ